MIVHCRFVCRGICPCAFEAVRILKFLFTRSEEEGEYHFRYYALPNTDEFIQVRLKRSSNCTAFQTWEACFALLEWVLTHSSAFKDSTILEVGSGSGLCGQMLQCIVENCSVVMSDYCNEVTEYILSNVEESANSIECLM